MTQSARLHQAGYHCAIQPIPAELLPIEETPVLKEAESSSNGVSIFVPSENENEPEFSVPRVLSQVERIKPVRRQALADIRSDKNGIIKFTTNVVKQMTRILMSTHDDEGPKTFLSMQWTCSQSLRR